MPGRSSVELDSVLDEVGHFGPYQARLYCAILGPIFFCAIYNAQYVFNAADADYRCAVPECESSSPQWEAGAWAEWALVSGSRCERRAVITPNGPCARSSFGEGTQRCTAWVYQANTSIVVEFDLACQDWKRALVGTVHGLGVSTALLYVGVLSDSIGRRTTFMLAASWAAVIGTTRSFATSYPMYLFLEYLDSTLGAGVYTTGFILALEMIGFTKRVLCSGILSSVYALGQAALALAAWAVPYWRTLTRILYAPSFFFLLYFFFIDESFRWLISKKKDQQAIRLLLKIARVNKRTLTESSIKGLTIASPEESTAQPTAKTQSILLQCVRSRILMIRVAICSCCWMTASFVYYGLSINSVSLAGNMYVNYALVSLVEIPGYAVSVLTLDRFGRRSSIMVSFLICGVTLIALAFVRTDGRVTGAGVVAAQVGLAMAGKLCVSAAFNGLYVFGSELFPTPVRHRAVAFCSLVARVGQILAMLTPLLLTALAWLPFLVFGVLACGAALLLLAAPETRHAPLPDTVAQAERLSAPPAPAPARRL